MRSACTGTARGAVVAASLVMTAAFSSYAADNQVVVTIKPLHSLVSRIMEGTGSPHLLVSGTASPHTYAMKPSDARAINSASVFFRVSEQIEPFTEKVVKSLPKTVRVVTLAETEGVELLDKRTGDTFEAHAHDDHDNDVKKGTSSDQDHDEESDKKAGHDDHDRGRSAERADHDHEVGSTRDGHVWLDPRNAKAMVEEIVKVLVATSPSDADRLKANAVRLLADLDALEEEIDRDLAPIKGKPFVVFHDAYQYFERRFGLNAVGSITISPDVQPSAKRLTEIRAKIATLDAGCVFAEPQFSQSLVATVTEGTSARSGTLDPEGATIKEGPGADFDLMRGLASGLKSCLHHGS